MVPGLLSDNPVNRQPEQRLERPHGIIGLAAEDPVDGDGGAIAAAVDLALNGFYGVAITSLLDRDDQPRPSLGPDDPVGGQTPRRLKRGYGASLADVVNIRTFLTDMSQLSDYGEVRSARFTGTPPTITSVEVSRLWVSGALLEVEVLAII
jgi:hypothetical protein